MASVTKFLSSSGGVDLALRLVQSIALIISSRTGSPEWTTAFEQLDYIRRPLRMFGWLGCWAAARSESLSGNNSLKSNLACLKMSFLGLFLFTEMFVLPYSMRLVEGPMGQKLQNESFKFWAYSLSFSIASHLITLWNGHPIAAPAKNVEKGKAPAKQSDIDRRTQSRIWKDLIVDACDFVIPAVTVGWMNMDFAVLGAVILVSTLGAASSMWNDLQG